MSCGLSFVVGVAVDNVEMFRVDVVANIIGVGDKAVVVFDGGQDECTARWWSVSGVLMSEEIVVGDRTLSSTPQRQGVYLLELVMGDERVVRKVVIE